MVDFGDPRGSAQAGDRPALVVSNDVNNQVARTVTVAAITRTIPSKQYPMNVFLSGGGALPWDGTILCGQLFTIDKQDLRRYRGTLDPPQVAQVDQALAKALALRLA